LSHPSVTRTILLLSSSENVADTIFSYVRYPKQCQTLARCVP